MSNKRSEYLNDANLRIVYDEYGMISSLVNKSGQVVLNLNEDLLNAPSNTVAPAITPASGVAGSVVFTSTTGTWLYHPRSYARQWYVDASAVEAETGVTYTTVAGDAGKAVLCKVVAMNTAGSSAAVASNAVTPADVPANSVAPAITPASGVAGDVLFTSTTGTWTNTPTSYTYQWQADGGDIAAATAVTYQTVAADEGKAVTCDVTAHNAAGASTLQASNSVTPAGVPVNSVVSVISPASGVAGTLVLSSTTGTWTNTPTSYTYQWQKAGVNIGAATAATYATVAGDAAAVITCDVTAHNGAGASTLATSNGVTPAGVPVNSAAPAITPASGVAGTLVLASTTGTWSNTPASYTYQWQKAGVNIGGATTNSYATVAGDAASAITCDVTAHNSAGASTLQASNGVTPDGVPANSVAPAITPASGVAGTVLFTSDNGTWTNTPTSYTYQWTLIGVPIAFADASTYQTVLSDSGKEVKCSVIAHNTAGASSATASNGVTPT